MGAAPPGSSAPAGSPAPPVRAGAAVCRCTTTPRSCGEHAGVDHQRVQFVVEGVQAAQHEPVEQLVDDKLDLQRGLGIGHGLAEGLRDDRRADGVAGVFHARVGQVRQALVEGEQRPLQAVFRLGDHAADGEGLLQLAVVDEGQ